eukprot:m51a1_g10053 hypothetical protein (784) ;mRNA; f:51801-54900
MAQSESWRLVMELMSKYSAPPAPHNFAFHPRLPQVYALLDAGSGTSLCAAPVPPAGDYEPSVPWEPLLKAPPKAQQLSREELLLRERMRTVEWGITSYHWNPLTAQFLIPVQGDLLICDVGSGEARVTMGRERTAGSPPMDPKLSADGLVLSFVRDGDLWVRPLGSTTDHRITTSHQRSKDAWAGESKFVMQEEFDLFSAYWWSPAVRTLPGGRLQYELLYLEEDESAVCDYTIAGDGIAGAADVYKYPLAGTANTRVSVCLARIVVNHRTPEGVEPQLVSAELLTVGSDVGGLFPWVEYVPRAGWTASGDKCWVQLLDRKQQRLALVTIPTSCFATPPAKVETSGVEVIIEEFSSTFVNVTDLCQPLRDGSFLWGSERTGFRHIYLVSPKTQPRAITAATGSEEWIVNHEAFWVDEDRRLVYFLCTKDTPLQMHVYAASYADGASPSELWRISEIGHDCENVCVHPTPLSSTDGVCAHVAIVTSNLHNRKKARLYAVSLAPQPTARCISAMKTMAAVAPPSWPVQPPEVFSFISQRHGRKLYGVIYRPPKYNPAMKYPTIVDVYGGPHVQQVRDNWDVTARQTRQLYASLDHVVVVLDNSGSANRGHEFEASIYGRLGTLEAGDQAEAIAYLSTTEPIDTERVAIIGWSYGGYTSLKALAHYGGVFRVAIAGAPVTMWEAYDTAYTERYMGLPSESPEAYNAASVVSAVSLLPAEDGRMLILHGLSDENVHFAHTSVLVDALERELKPHRLHVFPSERHGVRNKARRVFLEKTIIDFLRTYL